MAESVIQTYWRDNHTSDNHGLVGGHTFTHCPRLKCADGFAMSVQASFSHYSSPRDYVKDGSYSEWEVGFPSDRDELLMPFVENASDPTGTVYGYVPTDVVDAVIAAHGGLISAATAAPSAA